MTLDSLYLEEIDSEIFWSAPPVPVPVPVPVTQSAFLPYTENTQGFRRMDSIKGQSSHKRMIDFLRSIPINRARDEQQEFEKDRSYRHMISERIRREKQKRTYTALHSLLPEATKMEKISVLQMAALHLQELKGLKEELQKRNSELEEREETATFRLRKQNPSSGIDSMIGVLTCLKSMGLKARTVQAEFSAAEFFAAFEIEPKGPNIDNYMGEFSKILRPFILSYEDVEKDGNCGFRALAVAMGWTEEAWKQVRVDLLQEVTLYRDEYSKIFGSDEVVTKLQGRLKPLVSPARYDNWMLMPEAGYLASSRYNTAIVYIASRHCLSFLPLRSSVDAYGPKVVSIGHVQQNHFIKLNLASECPIPPPVEFWNRYHYREAESWVESLRNRIEAFNPIGVTINTRDAAPGEVIVLDS